MLEIVLSDPPDGPLAGHRIALLGKFASMSKKNAQQLIEDRDGTSLDRPEPDADWIVVGEQDLPSGGLPAVRERLEEATRRAVDEGRVELLTETELWRRLGFVLGERHVQQLYTPAMLAELLGVAVSQVRRWQRRGLIQAVREVRRLPYFDFREVATARRIVELLSAGVSVKAIEKQLAELRRVLPGVERPLADLPLVIEGKRLLIRQPEGLSEPSGQLRFDYAEVEAALAEQRAAVAPLAGEPAVPPSILSMRGGNAESETTSPQELLKAAVELEDEGQLDAAANMYRAALAAGGPTPEVCFLLAELLYRLGDLSGSRERYYMAIELDEDYVEARANLGCVLAEQGEQDLAVAAFSGALAFHPEYADAHYHLARALDDLNRHDEALLHWRTFLELAPETPWADEARERLSGQ